MESREPKRRFPQPWTAEKVDDGYVVKDANGIRLASIYCRDDLHAIKWADYTSHLTSDEARRIAKGIARLPEFLRKEPGFEPRRIKHHRYWKSSHPYHVALTDVYINENYDRMVATCAANNVPFDPTGEILEKIGMRWRTYQFARQLDAILFWDHFNGAWMLGNDFFYPERPASMLPMRTVNVPQNLRR